MKKTAAIIFSALALLFCSCSVSKKINQTAKNAFFHDKDFAGAHTGISIYEPASGKYWYQYQSEKFFTPASNTKLFTCYAAMKYLGDSLTGISYHLSNDSTVVIKGMGDPSFLHSDYAVNPVFDFLKNFRSIELIKPVFNDYLGSGWSWNDYLDDYSAARSELPVHGNCVMVDWNASGSLSFTPSLFRNRAEINEMLRNGYKVNRPWDRNAFSFTSGRTRHAEIPFVPDAETIRSLLEDTLQVPVRLVNTYSGDFTGSIHTQPTDSLLKPMMHRSDNFYAEQSLLMVSQRLLGIMNDRKITDTLLKTDFSGMPQKPSWVDGSGLSRFNLFSPNDVIFVLNKMKDEFGMERIKTILPTGGTGTISNYYLADSGYIFVKTGTLNGVVALSGFLYTKKNKLLLFSVLVNNHHTSSSHIREGIQKFIQAIRNRY